MSDLPTSLVGICKVHPAKSVPACKVSREFENLTRNSFIAGKLALIGIFSQSLNQRLGVTRNGADHEEHIDQSMIVCAEKSLFSLICTIGSIPRFVLEQAVSPQKRWNEYGREYETNPQNAQFGPHLKDLFLDSSRLWQTLERLLSLAAIGVENLSNMEVYICASTPTEYIGGQKRSYWVEQALWLFCYIFPRNPTIL